mmetsp:Transcript_30869/g.31162  ORF Transcript_30869/g.31162 Transcript_30869/m.31162 type:complete len:143 (-) Transcript_30869:490-918(-)
MRNNSAYLPPLISNSSCVPRSTTRPSSHTTISSQSCMVDSRCAMMIVVIFFPISFRLDMMSCSVSLSRLEVGSSHSRMGAFLRIALAIATRCFSPPESFRPLSPTTVSYPFGKRIIVLWILAALAAETTSSCDKSKFPYWML